MSLLGEEVVHSEAAKPGCAQKISKRWLGESGEPAPHVKARVYLSWSLTAPHILRCECTHAIEPLTFPNEYHTRQILAPYARATQFASELTGDRTESLHQALSCS